MALYVTPRGLTTSPIPDGTRTFQIDFDFIDHVLRISTSDGAQRQFALAGQSVASFYAGTMAALAELGIHVTIDEMPNELPDPIRFSADTAHASYDPDAVRRFLQILVNCRPRIQAIPHRLPRQGEPGAFLLGQFRSRGDAVLRPPRAAPSRRRAPPARCGGVRSLFARECSAGFWPGSGAIDYPAFYSYAYPEPSGYRAIKVRPDAAFFSEALGEFILPYDAVRTADDPDKALLEFLQSTYEAAANREMGPRGAGMRPGQPGVVRQV